MNSLIHIFPKATQLYRPGEFKDRSDEKYLFRSNDLALITIAQQLPQDQWLLGGLARLHDSEELLDHEGSYLLVIYSPENHRLLTQLTR